MSLFDWVKLRFASRKKPNPLPETSTIPSAKTGGGGGVAGTGGAGGCTGAAGAGAGLRASVGCGELAGFSAGAVASLCAGGRFFAVTGAGADGATSASGVGVSDTFAFAALRRVGPIRGVRVRGRLVASFGAEASLAAALVLGICSSSVMVKKSWSSPCCRHLALYRSAIGSHLVRMVCRDIVDFLGLSRNHGRCPSTGVSKS